MSAIFEKIPLTQPFMQKDRHYHPALDSLSSQNCEDIWFYGYFRANRRYIADFYGYIVSRILVRNWLNEKKTVN